MKKKTLEEQMESKAVLATFGCLDVTDAGATTSPALEGDSVDTGRVHASLVGSPEESKDLSVPSGRTVARPSIRKRILNRMELVEA